MSKPTTVAELLNASADIIEQVGMCTGELWPGGADKKPYTQGCPVCVYGAMYVVCALDALPKNALPVVVVLADLYLLNALDQWVHEWSDKNAHRPAYVVAELRRVAQDAERSAG